MLSLFQQVLENFRFHIDPEKSHDENVEDVVRSTALLTGAVAVEPLPFADILLILPLQAKMVLHIGKIYGFEIDASRASEIAKELGATLAYGWMARQVMRGVAKIVMPVIGGVITAPMVYGWTFALGKLAQRYFEAKIAGLPFSKTEQKQLAQQILPTIEKPSTSVLSDFAKELRNRAERNNK